jgi:hypothetical protein
MRVLIAAEVVLVIAALGLAIAWVSAPEANWEPPLALSMVLLLVIEVSRRVLQHREPESPEEPPEPYVLKYAQIDQLRQHPVIGEAIREAEARGSDFKTAVMESDVDALRAQGYDFVRTPDGRPCYFSDMGSPDGLAFLVGPGSER